MNGFEVRIIEKIFLYRLYTSIRIPLDWPFSVHYVTSISSEAIKELATSKQCRLHLVNLVSKIKKLNENKYLCDFSYSVYPCHLL